MKIGKYIFGDNCINSIEENNNNIKVNKVDILALLLIIITYGVIIILYNN